MKALILLFLLASLANARLNETVNECMRRYGEPFKVDKETMTLGFQKEDIFIMCVFDAGKCVEIAFHKPMADFSDLEVSTLRDVNGADWTAVENAAFGQLIWKNKSSYAVKIIGQATLLVMTTEQKARRDAEKAAEEKARLQGF